MGLDACRSGTHHASLFWCTNLSWTKFGACPVARHSLTRLLGFKVVGTQMLLLDFCGLSPWILLGGLGGGLRFIGGNSLIFRGVLKISYWMLKRPNERGWTVCCCGFPSFYLFFALTWSSGSFPSFFSPYYLCEQKHQVLGAI